MLDLRQLLDHDAIVLQCHNNPDADTIGSAWALYRYFEENGHSPRLVYGGFNPITKPNLAALVADLDIPLEYLGPKPPPAAQLAGRAEPLLVTVDCQYGAGNTAFIEAARVCVIDHHLQEKDFPAGTLARIEPYLGSCATVVWRLLGQAGFNVAAHRDVSTALYYALYTDTNSLAEIFHPIDRDMLEVLRFDQRLIKKLKGINLTREELLLAGQALRGARYEVAQNTALYKAGPCDPNILGFISDLMLQVEGVDTCVGFCEINDGVKLSLRSATGDVMANEMADYLTRDLGSGGGNREKAGGFMKPPPSADADAYLTDRIRRYHTSYDRVDAADHDLDLAAMPLYRKKKLTVGHVRLTDIYPQGTEVMVRTLEGDAMFTVSDDTYLMVGIQGETYPIQQEKFERSYERLEGKFAFDPALVSERFYAPTVRDRLYHKPVDLLPYIRPCRPVGDVTIHARAVRRDTKVFTAWYTDGYMLGKPGDYLAVRADDIHDVYIIDGDIFQLTYEPVG